MCPDGSPIAGAFFVICRNQPAHLSYLHTLYHLNAPYFCNKMENYLLNNDINVICVTADSFPDGILPAFEKLHQLVSANRRSYGISRPGKNGTIIYKAGAEELVEGEAEKLHLEKFVLKKGNYISIDITDFMKNIPAIGQAFEQLLVDTRIDPEGACVEWYFNEKDVKCMVRIIQSQI
jgi:hypothetical protein